MRTGICNELVDWFSEPLHRPSEAEVGLCGSWQKMARVPFRSSLPVPGSLRYQYQYHGKGFVDRIMMGLSNVL